MDTHVRKDTCVRNVSPMHPLKQKRKKSTPHGESDSCPRRVGHGYSDLCSSITIYKFDDKKSSFLLFVLQNGQHKMKRSK